MVQTYESGFETTLSVRLDPTDTTATLASVPTVTKGRMYLDNGEQRERIKFTGVSGSTITGLVRGLSSTADPSTAGTGLTWIAGTKIKLVAMHDQMVDKQEANAILSSAYIFADTTARDAALGGDGVATINYTNVKTTADGIFWRYNTTTNQWEDEDTGTTTPNASPTVSGSGEVGTLAQGRAGTSVGETGAFLWLTPDIIAQIVQEGAWVYCASSTGSDTYTANLTPAITAYTTGQLIPCKFTTTNTGACSLNLNGLGAKSIKTKDGNDPQTGVIRANGTALLMYDGTNFVLQGEDFATTGNRGIAEQATDAEALARTDTSRYVTPAHLGLVGQVAILQTTRALDAASATVNIAHGLGVTPKRVEITGYYGGSGVVSHGFSDFTTNLCSGVRRQGNGSSITTESFGAGYLYAINIEDSSSTTNGARRRQRATITADATNISIVRNYADLGGSPTGNIEIIILVHA